MSRMENATFAPNQKTARLKAACDRFQQRNCVKGWKDEWQTENRQGTLDKRSFSICQATEKKLGTLPKQRKQQGPWKPPFTEVDPKPETKLEESTSVRGRPGQLVACLRTPDHGS